MKVLTFGEIMLRLKAPGIERFFQNSMLEATFGGGEANVAVSLANYGIDVEYMTVLPQNVLGDECVKELRRFGVQTHKIQRGEGRMGIYFLEGGANQLPSKVVYDRAYSAIALVNPGEVQGYYGILRPELPQEPLEVWEEGAGGNERAYEICGRWHRQRGGLPKSPRHYS